MSIVNTCFVIALVLTVAPEVKGEARCPGNAASLRFPANSRSQIIVPVMINHSGPYEFLIDTGTIFTLVDTSLGSELHLKYEFRPEVFGVGFRSNSSMAHIESLQVGSQTVENTVVESLDFRQLPASDFRVRGILGASLLRNFDVLLDYSGHTLCLGQPGTMGKVFSGERVKMETLISKDDEAPSEGLVIIPVHLSGARSKVLSFALDSGSDVPYLFHPDKCLPRERFTLLPAFARDGAGRNFSASPPQSVEIGSLHFPNITFVSPARSAAADSKILLDGLLPTFLFGKVLICYHDRFVILEMP